MNEISTHKRIRVIKLFLTGLSYDEIAQQAGIAKGSVVNIINEFREGFLPVPPDMTEYIDTLRQVAVDLRKSNTSIAQVKSCLRLNAKLKEIGVSNEDAEQWLDICDDIASPTVSTGQFVSAALELAQLSSDSGLSYGDVIADYNTKLNSSKELDKEVEQRNGQLNEIRLKNKEEREQATKELDSITRAIAVAQDNLSKQKDDLKSRLDEYLVQNKLSWKKVNTVVALLDTELSISGLKKREIDDLSKRISHTGSLVNVIKQLEQEKEKLQSEFDKLAHKERNCAISVKQLKNIDENLRWSISANKQTLGELNTELKSQRVEFEELKRTTSQYTQNLYVARLILDFLFAPKAISDYDIDRLVGLMVGLRQKRLGIEPKRVTGANGEVICECLIPKIYGNIKVSDSDIDGIRGVFAHLLTPMVKDKFISRFDYDMAELKHKTEMLQAVIEERNRHIL